MPKRIRRERLLSEKNLAAWAKRFRKNMGISKAEAARRLKVTRGTIYQAEEHPEKSLRDIRVRMILKFSNFTVEERVSLRPKKG